jgi:ABC-2 type transport system ATP-binding protein
VAVIEVRGLTKRFGSFRAVDDLSFAVAEGSVVGFLGPNGAGKTTTLRMLLGLVRPTKGEALIHGRRYRDLTDPLRQVGAALEASSAHPGRTARAHLRIQALAAKVPPARVDEMLDLVGLASDADRRAGEFSLGMRQRLGLAAAMLPDPQLLILDEPANGLDPEGVRWLRDLLRGRAEKGGTVLISSHILAEVAQTVDTVVILDQGKLVVESPLSQLGAEAKPIVAVRTPKAADLAAALTADGAQVKQADDDRLEITGSTPERVADLAAERSIPIYESTTETPTLEDVFLRLTAAAEAGDKKESP